MAPHDRETEFLTGLMELSYGEEVEQKLRALAPLVSWAQGWPNEKEAFWNAEAFMWQYKVGKEVQSIIREEVAHLKNNLDLGCGSYSYVLSSVGFDLSAKMLSFNDRLKEKVQGDLEKPLPFPDSSFPSVTAVFVLNYVRNYQQLLREIHRVLAPEGTFMMVLSSTPVSEWQRQKEVTTLRREEWSSLLQSCGFQVVCREKEKIIFWQGKKLLTP